MMDPTVYHLDHSDAPARLARARQQADRAAPAPTPASRQSHLAEPPWAKPLA